MQYNHSAKTILQVNWSQWNTYVTMSKFCANLTTFYQNWWIHIQEILWKFCVIIFWHLRQQGRTDHMGTRATPWGSALQEAKLLQKLHCPGAQRLFNLPQFVSTSLAHSERDWWRCYGDIQHTGTNLNKISWSLTHRFGESSYIGNRHTW